MLPEFLDNRYMQVTKSSALRTCRLYPQGHNPAGRIKSMKNSNDTVGNQTRNLPPPRTPLSTMVSFNLWTKFHPLWIATYSLVWHVIQDDESKHNRAAGHRNKFCVLTGLSYSSCHVTTNNIQQASKNTHTPDSTLKIPIDRT